MLSVVSADLDGIFDWDVLYSLAGLPEDKEDQYGEWDIQDLREEAFNYYTKHPRKLADYYWYIVDQREMAHKTRGTVKTKSIVKQRKPRSTGVAGARAIRI